MLTYTDVTKAKPDALLRLATAWSGVADTHSEASKLLTSKASDTLHAKSLGGRSIRAAQGRADQLNEQIKAGTKEADDIAARIKAFAGQIKGCQDDLATLVSEAGHAGMDVDANGVVSVPPTTLTMLRDSGHAEAEAAAVDSAGQFNSRIKEVLQRATKADTTFNSQMRLIAELGKPFDASFNADAGQDLADARSRADAERVSNLLGGGKDHQVSEKELAQANKLMARHKGDDLFATTLMDDLGPQGLLSKTGEISFRFGSDGDVGNNKLVLDMQKQLGFALGEATDPDNASHVDKEWMAELRNQGASEFTLGNPREPGGFLRTPGYSLLAPMLTEGEYDSEFLTPVTHHMLALDKSGVDWGADDWQGPNPLIGDQRVTSNAVNGALIALDNNPQAATDALSTNSSGERYPGYPLGTGAVEKVGDPLDYLLKNAGDHDNRNTLPFDPDLTGNAIEAAATEGPADPERAADMADIAQRTIEYVGENPDEFKGEDSRMGSTVDNLGNIGAHHMHDIQTSFMSSEDAKEIPGYNPDGVNFGPLDSNGQHDLRQFLQVVGQDPHAGATMWGASQATAFNMGVEVGGDDQYENEVGDALAPHGRVTAELVNGKLEAIHDDHWRNVETVGDVRRGVAYVAGPATAGFKPLPAYLIGVGLLEGGLVAQNTTEDLANDAIWADQAKVSAEHERQFEAESDRMAQNILEYLGKGDEDSAREIAERARDTFTDNEDPHTDDEGREFGGN